MRSLKAINKPATSIRRTLIVSRLLVVLALLSLPAAAVCQAATVGDENEAVTEAKTQPLGFDPALVGLPDFPLPLSSPADFDLALELIEARMLELRAANGTGTDATAADESEPAVAAEDSRIEQLVALRDAVQQGVTVASHVGELETAVAKQKDSLASLERLGLENDPPFTIALFDQFGSERALIRDSQEMTERALDQARRRVEQASGQLDEAMRTRRRLRDAPVIADPDAASGAEVQRLEIARLAALLAFQRHQLALTQQIAARKSVELATARRALIEARIERIAPGVVFTRDALDERLAEVQRRAEKFRAQREELTRAGDLAEEALYEARRRLFDAGGADDTEALQEIAQAREDELAAMRSGADYAWAALALADTARTLLERRYEVLRGAGKEEWPRWLNETAEFMRKVAAENEFALANLGTLRAFELALGRRLAAPDLDPEVRRALMLRMDALVRHEALAEGLINTQDQVRSLAERLRLDLEPRVQTSPLEQQVLAARERLSGWWDSELFVYQDQAIYTRDLVKGLGVFLLVVTVVLLVKLVLKRRVLPRLAGNLGQEQRTYRVLAMAMIRKTGLPFIVILAFYEAMMVSGLAHGNLREWLWSLLVVTMWLQVGVWASAGATDLIQRQRNRKEQRDPAAVTGYGLLLFFVRVGIWMVVVVSVLSHFDYPIAGLIGALGVGGIAVAFAVQNILSDIFNSMAIVLDKPFRVGDFITTGDIVGFVEHIGVKTTQIRSLSGEQITLSNTDLLNSRIHNYKRMRERRVVFRIGVVYETSADTLEGIPGIIAEVIGSQAHARFDRAHFFEYGDFSLVFETVYYVSGADYVRYMDTQQAVNLGIYRRFQDAGIRFAFPTQELIVRRGAKASTPTLEAAS